MVEAEKFQKLRESEGGWVRLEQITAAVPGPGAESCNLSEVQILNLKHYREGKGFYDLNSEKIRVTLSSSIETGGQEETECLQIQSTHRKGEGK